MAFKAEARIVVALVLWAGRTHAHGVEPQALSIAPRAGTASLRLVGTTFGALLTSDDGATWRWICEEAIGYGEGQRPVFHFGQDGAIFAATLRGMFVSRDGGCSWATAPEFVDTGAADVFALEEQPSRLYVATGRYGVTNRVLVSSDSGETFSQTLLQRDDIFFSNVRAAPSNPSRLYVSAWWFTPSYTARLFVSDDAGASFSEADVTGLLPIAGPFYVHAVHPTEPSVILGSVTSSAAPTVTHLVRSTESGASFTSVLSTAEAVTSVAFSADGATVWVATAGQLYRSTDAGATFTALATPQKNACIARVGTTLHACGWPVLDGWAVGQSVDQGDSFSAELRWSAIAGPLECPDGSTVKSVCEALWPEQKAQLADEWEGDGGGPVDPAPVDPPPCGCGVHGSGLAVLGAGVMFVLRRRRPGPFLFVCPRRVPCRRWRP